jgi:RHS repeat-associated protein
MKHLGHPPSDDTGTMYGDDDENHIATVGSYAYNYDGDGNRVSKIGSSSLTPYANKTVSHAYAGIHTQIPNGTFDLRFANAAILHANGSVTPIFTGQSGMSVANFSGQNCGGTGLSGGTVLTASTDPAVNTNYYVDDHLGTAQMETSGGGWPVWEGQFTPFGLELPDGNTAMHYKFTGKERDAESGLDYFKYRMYASSMGRWMSPDPSKLTYADLGNPQSLNLYNYVGNNPLTRADLDGLCWKGFQWACDLGQRIGNGVTGYGWHTNQQVNDIVSNTQKVLNKLPGGDKLVETLTRKQTYKLGTGQATEGPEHDGVRDVKIAGKVIFSLVMAGGAPRPPKNFQQPTNPPQEPMPESQIPAGWRVRTGLPTENYPNGYWRLEKPMNDGGWQGIDPSTMRPGGPAETHIPLPPPSEP